MLYNLSLIVLGIKGLHNLGRRLGTNQENAFKSTHNPNDLGCYLFLCGGLWGFCVWSLFFFFVIPYFVTLLPPNLAIDLMVKRELVALLYNLVDVL